VQLVLAHADGRIRADRAEDHVVGNIVGQNRVDVLYAQRLSVATDEIERAFVDVDGPDGRMRRIQRERQCDRSPPAPEIQQISARRRRRRVRQQHAGSRVDVVRTEHTAGGGHLDLTTRQTDADATQILGTGG
jgi:hypothetical protein